MRLGVLMLGAGAHAAASVGLLSELARRQIEPYAICGMQAAAWPAALHCAGCDAARLEEALLQAVRMGERLVRPGASARAVLRGSRTALCDGARMERLLSAQTGQRILALCPRRGLFLCRMAKNGHRVIFSTQAYAQEYSAMLTMQASVSFAARAAMAMPPFLSPLAWMGSPLVPEQDAAFACRQLLAMGAHRVLIAVPQLCARREMDALDLAALTGRLPGLEALPENTGVLRMPMPEDAGALSLDRLPACAQAGQKAAQEGLDRVFEQMGMAFCRVIPFRPLSARG